MKDYYALIGVESGADHATIKRAFRARIKALHPDTASRAQAQASVHDLLEAWEVLSDPQSRTAYDQSLGLGSGRVRPGPGFDYRAWLASQKDLVSQSKLIFFDLLRGRAEEALDLYQRLKAKPEFSLERGLGVEDFMDCAFLLAEQYELREDWVAALMLYWRIALLETRKPFFRHFFAEVDDRVRRLVHLRLRSELGPQMMVQLFREAQDYPFSPKTKVLLLKRLADTLWSQGEGLEALRCVQRARALVPKDSTLGRLVKDYAHRLGVAEA